MNPLLAAATALAMGSAPLLLEMNGQVKADVLFGAILVIAMVVAVGSSPSESARQLLIRGAILGMLAGSAMLVRTIGFTLVFGLWLEMLLRRRWSQVFGFGAANALVLGPWMAWSFFHNGGTFHSYASENLITWQTPISHFWLLASKMAPNLAFAPFEGPKWVALAMRLHLSGVTILLGLGLTALVILGWANLLLRRHVVALVLGPYMAIVFLWWFEPTRFVIPVLPLIVFCAIAGARLVHAVPTRRAALTAAAICIVGGLAVDAVRLRRAMRYGNIEGAQAAAEWQQMQQGLNWIRSNTPGDAVVFSCYPQAVYLFTSRHTMDLNNGSHIDAVYIPMGQMDLNAQFHKADGFSSVYVYATYRWDFLTQMEWGLAPVQRFVASHPGQLDPQWASGYRAVGIFRLCASGGGGFMQILHGPHKLLYDARESDRFFLAIWLIAVGLFAINRQWNSLPGIFLVLTTIGTSVVYGSPGTKSNHLVDITAASILLIAVSCQRNRTLASVAVCAVMIVVGVASVACWRVMWASSGGRRCATKWKRCWRTRIVQRFVGRFFPRIHCCRSWKGSGRT